jgi:hypothetical protein
MKIGINGLVLILVNNPFIYFTLLLILRRNHVVHLFYGAPLPKMSLIWYLNDNPSKLKSDEI